MLPGRDIEASQSLAKEIGKITKYQAAYDRKRDALDRDAVHSLALSGSVVLPHKGDGRLIKGVHGGVDKASMLAEAEEPAASTGSSKELMADWMTTLDRENTTPWQPAGQTHLEDTADDRPLKAQLIQFQPESPLLPHQAPNH